MSVATIVGVDCATDPRKTGIVALHRTGEETAIVTSAALGDSGASVAEIVQAAAGDGDALFCLDAPLGWPGALGPTLAPHAAGEALAVTEPDRLFRRRTDDFVRRKLGKRPLEVGADRIARTAISALVLLEAVRRLRGQAVPLAWTPQFRGSVAIEVYPAAVLICRGLPALKYKPAAMRERRREILRGLADELDPGPYADFLLEKPDALDAALAAMAGLDFLRGLSHPPEDLAAARTEGWIWFRRERQPAAR